MQSHDGPILVYFHGEFLDGHAARSGETLTGEFTDYWAADAVYPSFVAVPMFGFLPALMGSFAAWGLLRLWLANANSSGL